MPDLIGTSFGRYSLLEKLGEGGMAIVYKAHDTHLDTDVALKIIRTDSLPQNAVERSLKRFEREAKALARLTHPNIVKVMDYGEHDGQPYLVMPYLQGGTLKGKMGQPMPWQDAVRLLIPIAEALGYAHHQNLIHRDVKPSNIMLTQSGQPMLTDFGIAKMLDLEDTIELTGTSAAVGTPEYMAPEQATSRDIDHRADIYALGIVLYEMVTGRKPYVADTPLAVLIKQAHDPLPSARRLIASLPENVEKVLIKALAKKPEDRFQSMGEMVKALEKLSQQKTLSIVREKPVSTDVQRRAAPREVRREPGPERTGKGLFTRRSYWAFGFAAVVLITIVSILVVNGNPFFGISPTLTQTSSPLQTSESTARTPAAITATSAIDATASPAATEPALPSEIMDAKGVSMVLVPAGEFIMGMDAADALATCEKFSVYCEEVSDFEDRAPAHSVNLDAYYIDKYEVTNAQYKACVTAGRCQPPRMNSSYSRASYYGIPQYDKYPVIHMDWNSANTYCAWRGANLPTEAQWEKAARGTEGSMYPWGNEYDRTYASYGGEVRDTTEVGIYSKSVSPYGAYDMLGNVWEWVADWFDENYYKISPTANPLGPSGGTRHIARGGSWFSSGGEYDVTYRWAGIPYNTFEYGFRCAKRADETNTADTPTPITQSPTDSGQASMIHVPAGVFYMGSSCAEPGCVFKKGGRNVSTDEYWIDKTEVSNAMYAACVLAGVCTQPSSTSLATIQQYYDSPEYAAYPVVNIDYQQAVSYCEWTGGRLPTGMEWEKAARGTDGRGFPWGLEHQGFEANFCDVNCSIANARDASANDGYAYTAPVDSFSLFASPYGVLNMAGNVSEIVSDGDVRGGAWNSVERILWTFFVGLAGDAPGDSIGFRCVYEASSGGSGISTQVDVTPTVPVQAQDIPGTWDYSVFNCNGVGRDAGSFVFQQDGIVTASGETGTWTLDGDLIEIVLGDQYSGTVDGDEMAGTVRTLAGVCWTAQKQK